MQKWSSSWNFFGNKKKEADKTDEELEGVRAMFRGPIDVAAPQQSGLTPKIKKVAIDSTTASTTDGASESVKITEANSSAPIKEKETTDPTTEKIQRGLTELEQREIQLRKDLDDYKSRIDLKRSCSEEKKATHRDDMEEGELSENEEEFARNLSKRADHNSTMEELRLSLIHI